jgi:hypothetical protein
VVVVVVVVVVAAASASVPSTVTDGSDVADAVDADAGWQVEGGGRVWHAALRICLGIGL